MFEFLLLMLSLFFGAAVLVGVTFLILYYAGMLKRYGWAPKVPPC